MTHHANEGGLHASSLQISIANEGERGVQKFLLGVKNVHHGYKMMTIVPNSNLQGESVSQTSPPPLQFQLQIVRVQNFLFGA